MSIRPWLLVVVLCLLYALAVVTTQGGALALVTPGTRFSDGDPANDEGTEGYDGQFVYFIARDPSDAARFLDVPAYRFQRILLPALGMILSLGQASLIPYALLAINLISVALGTALLEGLLVRAQRAAPLQTNPGIGVSRWYALGYGLSLGVLGAARLSLPEPLAYALALGGIVLMLRERPLWSAVLFALAALAKETTLMLAAGCGLYLLSQRRWRDAVAFGLVALAPFVIWQGILYAHFGTFGVGSGGGLATGFETIPFAGAIRIVTEGGLLVLRESGTGAFLVFMLVFAVTVGVFVLAPTLWGLFKAWRDARRNAMTLYTWLLLAASLVMLFVPFSTYREPLGILRFIVGLQIAVILYAAHARSKRTLRNSTLWAFTVLFVVLSDFSGGMS